MNNTLDQTFNQTLKLQGQVSRSIALIENARTNLPDRLEDIENDSQAILALADSLNTELVEKISGLTEANNTFEERYGVETS
jgi:hypothetical protein